jgi:hypothetical protein
MKNAVLDDCFPVLLYLNHKGMPHLKIKVSPSVSLAVHFLFISV